MNQIEESDIQAAMRCMPASIRILFLLLFFLYFHSFCSSFISCICLFSFISFASFISFIFVISLISFYSIFFGSILAANLYVYEYIGDISDNDFKKLFQCTAIFPTFSSFVSSIPPIIYALNYFEFYKIQFFFDIKIVK